MTEFVIPSRVNVVQVVAEVSLYCHVLELILPVDESVNTTFSGATPCVGVAEKCALGVWVDGAASTIVTNEITSMKVINRHKILFFIINPQANNIHKK